MKKHRTAAGLVILLILIECLTLVFHMSIYVNLILSIFFIGHACASWMKKQLSMGEMILIFAVSIAFLILAVYF